jgi:hypothetical protein
MKKATFSPDGVITGFYDTDVHSGNIPQGAVDITYADWLRCINEPNKWIIQDSVVVQTPPQDPDTILAAKRDATAIGKGAFCMGLIGLGIIAADEAVSAARGNWPASMDAFLSYLSADQAIAAQIEWATKSTINRNNVFVLTLGSWLDDITPEILDTLFGIG